MINCQGPFEYNRYMGEGICTREITDMEGETCYGFKIPVEKEICFFLEEEIVAEFTDDNEVRPLICDPENYPEDEESPYCEKCGSCGEDGCCTPAECEAVKFMAKRTYYHDFGYSATEPDYEMMVAYLIDEGVVWVNCNEDKAASLYININDYFAPAADAEDLPFKDIPKLFEMYRKDGYNGVAQYVADKRGILNQHWRDK